MLHVLYVLHLCCIISLRYLIMKLWFDKRLSDPTYYVQIGVRNGKKVTSKNIAKIGKHSELLKQHPDPLAFARSEIKRMNEEKDLKKVQLIIDLEKRLQSCDDLSSRSTSRNIGYFLLDQIYKDMHVDDFFKNIMQERKATFDMSLINRTLTFDRILDPGSKLHSVQNLSKYYGSPSFDHQHVLRFMDIMEQHYDDYIAYLYQMSNKVIDRDTAICYYDCTNFYSEIEQADEDYIDKYTGERIQGFRKYGFSKQHMPNPLVQMGLCMDKDGIPMTMCVTRGNQSEKTTVLPAESKLIKAIEKSELIFCADAGLGTYDIRKFNSIGGRKFIITQSLKQLPATLKEAVFNDHDYKLLSDDRCIKIETLKAFDPASNLSLYEDKAYKVVDASKELTMEFYEERIVGNRKKMVKAKATLQQQVIITFSRKMYEYQRNIRNKQIERAKKMIEEKDPEAIKKGPNDVRRFIKKKAYTKESYILDEEKIREEERYDGYYALATNIYDMPLKSILKIAANRYKIEECFRIIKTDMNGRPFYHQLKKRIIAHFMICYTALLLYRLLEVKLDRNGTHFTTRQIIDTLKNMNVAEIDPFVYKSLYTNSKALEAMMTLYPLDLDKEYYLKTRLDKFLKR